MDPAKQLVWTCNLLLYRKFQMLRGNWKRIWDWSALVSEGASLFVFVFVFCLSVLKACPFPVHPHCLTPTFLNPFPFSSLPPPPPRRESISNIVLIHVCIGEGVSTLRNICISYRIVYYWVSEWVSERGNILMILSLWRGARIAKFLAF